MSNEGKVVEPGTFWLARLEGRPCKVRVMEAITKRSGATRYRLFNETTNTRVRKLRTAGFLLEPWTGSLHPKVCWSCQRKFATRILPHTCESGPLAPHWQLSRKRVAAKRSGSTASGVDYGSIEKGVHKHYHETKTVPCPVCRTLDVCGAVSSAGPKGESIWDFCRLKPGHQPPLHKGENLSWLLGEDTKNPEFRRLITHPRTNGHACADTREED